LQKQGRRLRSQTARSRSTGTNCTRAATRRSGLRRNIDTLNRLRSTAPPASRPNRLRSPQCRFGAAIRSSARRAGLQGAAKTKERVATERSFAFDEARQKVRWTVREAFSLLAPTLRASGRAGGASGRERLDARRRQHRSKRPEAERTRQRKAKRKCTTSPNKPLSGDSRRLTTV